MVRSILSGKLFSVLTGFLLVVYPGWTSAQAPGEAIFHVEGSSGEKFYLEEYFGHKKNLVDSALSDKEGKVFFGFAPGAPPGMYRMSKNRDQGLDFLFTGNTVEIKVLNDFTLEGVEIISGVQNRIFYRYLNAKNTFERKLSALDQLLAMYPEKDDFYLSASQEFDHLRETYEILLDSLAEVAPGSLAATIIVWDQLPDFEPGALDPSSREFLKSHYFDPVSMESDEIVRTPILPIKVINYLSLYIIPGTPREKQEDLFIQGVDSLMMYTEGSPAIRQAMIEYILEGFKRYGFEKVITHIGQNYVLGQSCVSEQEEQELRKRIEGFTAMAVGEKAPAFTLPAGNDELFHSDDLSGKYRLIFFWASWCPHCTDIIAHLKEFYEEHSDQVEIVAISVDEHEDEWRQAVEEHGMPWHSFAELQGWEGPTVVSYYIYATPTLYLLDQDMEIIAKPANIEELENYFKGSN